MPVKKILNKLNGLHYAQEYLCLATASLTQSLHVYLVKDQRIIKDITKHHLFIGYSPLVYAFSANEEMEASIHLILSNRPFQQNEYFSKKDAIASLQLQQIKKEELIDDAVLYYEGVSGVHHFLSAFHQFINGLNNQWFNKKPGNVFLPNDLYRQVQIAYSVPRNISLITISNKDLFNLFPTDLHGQIDEDHYIISLRVGGKACEQVEAAGKVLISQVDRDAHKTVYALGKNHMQELKTKEDFPFSESYSENLKWPVPQNAIAYRELSLVNSFIHGIHKIMLFRIISQQQLTSSGVALAHIHNSYASWRHKMKLPGNYLLH